MAYTLVTGGAGFIGSHLCENLIRQNKRIICFDNLSTGSLSNIRSFKDKLIFVKGDVTNKKDLIKVFSDYDIGFVYHHAAVVGVKRTLENPLEVLNDINGTINILELARKHDVKKIVYASSSEVYGEPVEIPEVEDGHVNAKLPYAVTKLMSEKYLEAYYKTYGLPACSLRFFNVYGPRQESSAYGFVVGIFIKRILDDKQPTIFGDGTQTRDFVYIDDNIKATILAMESDKTNGEVVNIGTGKPTTILDLAEDVIHLCGKDLKPSFVEAIRQDIKHRFPNVSKMKALLKFKPEFSLQEGLKRTINWYKTSRIR